MRAVIVGGGIAGPVLGMFLKQAGWEVVICEARDSVSEREGAFLGLAPNGMNVLAALGLARTIEELGCVSRGFRFENARGRLIGSIDQSRDATAFGQCMVMIRRATLHHALLDEARERGVRVEFRAKVREVELAAEHAIVICEDGRRERGDILIGCDGLRSRIRSLLLPEAAGPEYTGLLDFGGFTHALPDDPLAANVNTMVFGKRGFFGAFVTERRELWWFHKGGCSEPIHQLDPETRRAHLLAQHEHDPAWIRSAIARTEEILGPWPLYVMPPLKAWHRGRACIIGDAAHATAPSGGQGASMALEDAMLLARRLSEAREPTSAFSAFERERRPRVKEIDTISRRNSKGKVDASPLSAWLRDRMLSTFLKLGEREQERAFGYRIV
jgi:2-polyprenyl-6-methoxyphenol hydroxylase-like FAD-dependent oxidoreductase